MEAVLVTRLHPQGEAEAATTADFRLEVQLADQDIARPLEIAQLSPSDWPGASNNTRYPNDNRNADHNDSSHKVHTLPGFSPFGSGERNEFATWLTGRETYLSSSKTREAYEDDLRSFAEQSDHTEGFMITTPISDGFGGLTSMFLETLRDNFSKSTVFITAMMTDSRSWKRKVSERSACQRLLNEALSIQHLEELSSMLLPIQAVTDWEHSPIATQSWSHFLRPDLDRPSTYSQVLTAHLQSANSELREPDGLNNIVGQLNWRGDNKIVHLSGALPQLPAEHFQGSEGQDRLKCTIKDFSVSPRESNTNNESQSYARSEDPAIRTPFAQYTVVRGFGGNELQQLGTILEASTTLKEPLSTWVCLPQPYPILPKSNPIFQNLLPNGRPTVLEPVLHSDPLSPAGLFGLPDPISSHHKSTSLIQPRSVPILTTLATTPSSRFLLLSLHSGVKELLRVKSSHLREYEEGEYGLGREGLIECRERLRTLADIYSAGTGTDEGRAENSDTDEEGPGTDEDWDMD